MTKKKMSIIEVKQKNKKLNFLGLLFFLLFSVLTVSHTALALNEECSTDPVFTYDSTNPLCEPGIETTNDYVIDGSRGDWRPGNYHVFNDYAAPAAGDVQVFVSHKKRGFNKADLFLFFEVSANDPDALCADEIRIGLNPSDSDPTGNTLIKFRPFWADACEGGTSTTRRVKIEAYDYDDASSSWTPVSSSWLPPANFAVVEDPATESWSVEMKIPLDQLPTPITTNDFRLILELHSARSVTGTMTFAWPAHYPIGLHNYICTNSHSWYPMSFGDTCYADLSIGNGLYSCDDVYISRRGVKSREIVAGAMNEFHADVTNNSTSKVATDAQVYMTLLKLGTGTAPIAMNYDHNNTNIKNWFHEQWGSWLFATDKLDYGTPKPPTKFTIAAGTEDTAARFYWKPSDESRFGDAAGMAGTHRCTAAFVDYKDDPDMSNNFSYCNTSIVNCPTGAVCALSFWMGPHFAYNHPPGNFKQRFRLSALNEPYEGWFEKTKITLSGEGVKSLGRNLFEAPIQKNGEKPLKLEITLPSAPQKYKYKISKSIPGLVSEANAQGMEDVRGPGNNQIRERNERLKKIYGDRPIVLVEGIVPAGYKTGTKKDNVQLYRVTSYVAYAINQSKPEPPCQCGACRHVNVTSYALSALFALFGLVVIRRKVVKKKTGKK